jgi:hypothetical protein
MKFVQRNAHSAKSGSWHPRDKVPAAYSATNCSHCMLYFFSNSRILFTKKSACTKLTPTIVLRFTLSMPPSFPQGVPKYVRQPRIDTNPSTTFDAFWSPKSSKRKPFQLNTFQYRMS